MEYRLILINLLVKLGVAAAIAAGLGITGYFALVFGCLFIFLSAASFASAARLSLSYADMFSG